MFARVTASLACGRRRFSPYLYWTALSTPVRRVGGASVPPPSGSITTAAAPAAAEASSTTSTGEAPLWQSLISSTLAHAAPSESEPKPLSSSCLSSSQVNSGIDVAELVSWWERLYHARLFAPEQNACAHKDAAFYLPDDVADAAVLIQALCKAIGAMRASGCISRTTFEMEAVVVYLLEHRLRFFMLSAKPDGNDGNALEQQRGSKEEFLPPTSVSELMGTSALRVGRMKDLVQPHSEEALLRIMVLLDTIHTALHTIQMTHRTHSVLYELARCALSGQEQLPSATLANLATCLAQCAQSYGVILQLSPYVPDIEDSSTGEDTASLRTELRRYLRPSDAEVCPAEEEERRVMSQYLGGLQSAVSPSSVLSDMQVLARESRARITDMLDVLYTAQDTPEAVAGALDPRHAADMAKKNLANKGKLGLMSLAERKRLDVQKQKGSPARQRRTLGSFEPQDQLHHPEGEGANEHNESYVREMSLTDVAEISTAIASIHYTDHAYWESVARFTRWSISMLSSVGEASEDGTHTAMLMREVRDVCFALDFVGKAELYAEVMQQLVAQELLPEPITAPSLTRRSMKDV